MAIESSIASACVPCSRPPITSHNSSHGVVTGGGSGLCSWDSYCSSSTWLLSLDIVSPCGTRFRDDTDSVILDAFCCCCCCRRRRRRLLFVGCCCLLLLLLLFLRISALCFTSAFPLRRFAAVTGQRERIRTHGLPLYGHVDCGQIGSSVPGGGSLPICVFGVGARGDRGFLGCTSLQTEHEDGHLVTLKATL